VGKDDDGKAAAGGDLGTREEEKIDEGEEPGFM